MKTIMIAAAAGFLSLSLVNPADAATCKGLDQATCSSNGQCAWRTALVKGETQTKAGTPAKVSRKAHCAAQRGKSEKS